MSELSENDIKLIRTVFCNSGNYEEDLLEGYVCDDFLYDKKEENKEAVLTIEDIIATIDRTEKGCEKAIQQLRLGIVPRWEGSISGLKALMSACRCVRKRITDLILKEGK